MNFADVGRPDARLREDAQTWLPTHDRAARDVIVAALAMASRTGGDPIAALRDAMSRWFGAAAKEALPPEVITPVATPTADGIGLEPLPRLRRPTLWPQRPKRFSDELFSSWLWRAGVAAGAPPKRFAAEVLGVRYADPDAEVSETTVRELALRSGQPASWLTAGTLMSGHAFTRADVVHDALLRHGGFVLHRQPRAARPRAAVQYCPRCLVEGSPYFRRGWRFTIMAACVRHGCRLHDACWRCGTCVDPLARATRSFRPCCADCGVALADGPVAPATETSRRQRGLLCVLYYAAACLEESGLHARLDALARRISAGRPVAKREQMLRRCRPSNIDAWFGAASDPCQGDLLRRHARGEAYGAWFASADGGCGDHIRDVVSTARVRPLSRQKQPRASWFAARPPQPVRSAIARAEDPCRT
jgi:TniQ